MSKSCKVNRIHLFYRIFRSRRKWWKAPIKCSQSDDDKHANKDDVTHNVKGGKGKAPNSILVTFFCKCVCIEECLAEETLGRMAVTSGGVMFSPLFAY